MIIEEEMKEEMKEDVDPHSGADDGKCGAPQWPLCSSELVTLFPQLESSEHGQVVIKPAIWRVQGQAIMVHGPLSAGLLHFPCREPGAQLPLHLTLGQSLEACVCDTEAHGWEAFRSTWPPCRGSLARRKPVAFRVAHVDSDF